MTSPTLYLKDCNLALLATGISAESLLELKERIAGVPASSIYYHFWGGRLRVSFVHPEYHNDFALWTHFNLRDEILTERLAIIDPTEFPDMEELRKKVIDVIEERLDELAFVPLSRREHKFHFLRSITMVYDLGLKTNNPSDLKEFIQKMTATSIFYHFIDARRRTKNQRDDFTLWLEGFGKQYEQLVQEMQHIDYYFLSLSSLRQKLIELFGKYL